MGEILLRGGQPVGGSLAGVTAAVFMIAVFFFSVPTCPASATSVYIAQSSTGAASGADCADAFPVSWFNTAANWGSAAAQIGPGTTVYLCGTFTGAANSTMLSAQGSGASGNPITIMFETGANLTAPYWSASGGAINLGSQSYITVNGGTNGIIQDTQNGTGLTYQVPSLGIYTVGGNVTIENLTIENLYVHTSPSDTTVDQTEVRCVYLSGSNVTVTNNLMHDAGWCVFHIFNNGDANVTVSNNQIYNIDHGIMVASGVAGGNSGPFSYFGNYIHDYANWDTTTNVYHHDGLHCFTDSTDGVPAHFNGLNIYNNWFDGGTDTTTTYTAHIFLEGGNSSNSTPCADATSSVAIYNNVLIGDQPVNNGLLNAASGNVHIYNNTIIDNNPADVSNPNSFCYTASSAGAALSVVFENNVLSGCDTLVYVTGVSSFTTNYNVYANAGGNAFINGSNYFGPTQLSSWQSSIGGDASSSYRASAGLSSLGVPSSGAATINAGANLTGLSIAPLDMTTSAGDTITPIKRPPTGSTWDVGAYEFQSSAQAPSPATGLTATPH